MPIHLSSETSNSSCQRKQFPRTKNRSINKDSNHLSREVDLAAPEEDAVELEVAASEEEALLAVVPEEEDLAVVEEAEVATDPPPPGDFDIVYLN